MKKHELSMLYISYAAAVISFGAVISLAVVAYQTVQRQKATIDGVCSWSIDGDTMSEKSLCGRLQAATKTEYMCSDDAHCWIELK